MTRPYDLVFDQWTPLAHKQAVPERTMEHAPRTAPMWVREDQRRLNAYTVLRSYIDNFARHFADIDSEDDRAKRREFGDAALLVQTVVDALLGETQKIVVDGAKDYDPDAAADLPRDVRVAGEWQKWLEKWEYDEKLVLAMHEAEPDAVGLGDGVYVLNINRRVGRVTVEVFDPSMYFPDLDSIRDGFPTTVHVAWEVEGRGEERGKRFIHRRTWRLLPIGSVDEDDGTAGQARRLAWNDRPATETCYITEGVWNAADIEGRDIHDPWPKALRYSQNEDGIDIRDVDTELDFIPVVHIPNTPNRKEHFGRSLLTLLAQLLDSIHATDTDLDAAAATTGTPPLYVKGEQRMPTTGAGSARVGRRGRAEEPPAVRTRGPGTVYERELGMLDTSNALDALLKLLDERLSRLHVNSQVPAEAVGRVRASDIEAGILMLLSFGPMIRLIERLRLVRSVKYALLLKFVQRMSIAAGFVDAGLRGAPPRAVIEFGSFLPTDEAAEVERIIKLHAEGLISTPTAVEMLVALGVADVDVAAEMLLIRSEDFEGADLLFDVAGERAAAEYLGLNDSAVEPRPEPGAAPRAPGAGAPGTEAARDDAGA